MKTFYYLCGLETKPMRLSQQNEKRQPKCICKERRTWAAIWGIAHGGFNIDVILRHGAGSFIGCDADYCNSSCDAVAVSGEVLR